MPMNSESADRITPEQFAWQFCPGTHPWDEPCDQCRAIANAVRFRDMQNEVKP